MDSWAPYLVVIWHSLTRTQNEIKTLNVFHTVCETLSVSVEDKGM